MKREYESNYNKLKKLSKLNIIYPKGKYNGRGVVMCAGGKKYLTNAWVAIHMLRDIGCNLPVEIWYLGSKEISERWKLLFRKLNVRFIDCYEVRKIHPMKKLGGWESKAFAILYSSFKELIFLDADNVVCRNPVLLFETSHYKETGALFWRDGGTGSEAKGSVALWKNFGLTKFSDTWMFESGQLVVNKEKCWKPLVLALHINEESDFYYDHIYGDKDSFKLGFDFIDQNYYIYPHAPTLYYGYVQYDEKKKPLFYHRITSDLKWRLDKVYSDKEMPSFVPYLKINRFLDDLRNKFES